MNDPNLGRGDRDLLGTRYLQQALELEQSARGAASGRARHWQRIIGSIGCIGGAIRRSRA